MTLSNYLFFTTTCEAALAFYEQCGMGKAAVLLRHGVGGMPAATAQMQGKVAHARFEGPGVLFHASDNHDAEPMRGSAHFLTLDSPDEAERLFARLGAGGLVTTPFKVQSWGGYYGKLTDQFGVQWMVSAPRA
jgi:PhnB protein